MQNWNAHILRTTNNAYHSENYDRSFHNLQYLFKSITNDLHCKQQYDFPPVVTIGQERGVAEKVERDCVSTGWWWREKVAETCHNLKNLSSRVSEVTWLIIVDSRFDDCIYLTSLLQFHWIITVHTFNSFWITNSSLLSGSCTSGLLEFCSILRSSA
jgi:hypothetical protein